MLSAITSPTAVVMPIVELAHALTDRGIEVLVDGAHAPGQVPVDIAALEAAGVSYWTGNAHKWLCAPKGSGILWVRRDRQSGIRPLVISHGANAARADRSRFRLEFDWQGTDDWSAPLSIPAAIDIMAGWVPDGWREIMARNHALAIGGRDLVCDRLGLEPATPDSMVGAMAAIPLPVDPVASDVPFAARHRPAPGGAHGAPPDPGPDRTVADGVDARSRRIRAERPAAATLGAALQQPRPTTSCWRSGLAELPAAR